MPLISDSNITQELRLRSSKLEFKTVSGKNLKSVKKKAAPEEEEGWKIHKKNLKSFKLAKEKTLDIQLEDELWCIVAKMGFHELSSGRNFKIQDIDGGDSRQIDVFAKDEDVALIIECTQSDEPKKKSLAPLIQKITAMKSGVFKAITKHYGKESKIKPRFIIATRNIKWQESEVEKCKTLDICILSDDEIDYYQKLTSHLHEAARYQLLGHVFSGVDIANLKKTVPATKGTMGGRVFYSFLASPDDLLKISYVGHKSSRIIDDLETYQRLLKPNRLRKIAKYINEGGKFPTNIVVNFKTKGNFKLRFDQQNSIGDLTVGTLSLPSKYGSTWIIDGQHRLYGYALSRLESQIENDHSVVPVLAFENLPAEDEMKMFIDINHEQVKVQKSLLVELYSDLHWNSPNHQERLQALTARVTANLNADKTSPIRDRITKEGKQKNSFRCLTQTSLSDGLNESRLLGVVQKGIFKPGPLANNDPGNMNDSLKKATNVISHVLGLFSEGAPGNWMLGDKPGGYLCTNNAIRAIFLVMMDLLNHISHVKESDLALWSSEEINSELEKHMVPLVEFFKSASPEIFQSFRRQTALAGVKKQSLGMEAQLKNAFDDFNPLGLNEYINSRDEVGTNEAGILIKQITKSIHKFTVGTLKRKYGIENDNWWLEGIPEKIRTTCAVEWEQEKRANPVWTYIKLINYQDIARLQWELMGDNFSLGNMQGSKEVRLSWLKKLNEIFRITLYPENGVLESSQVEFVKETWTQVQGFFNPSE